MKLSEFKNILKNKKSLDFYLENGDIVPPYFHITEVGQVSKKFIDCGGVIRDDSFISMQLWHANDFDHRLSTQKVIDIIYIAEKKLPIEDLEIEVEYQKSTIGKYSLEYNGTCFVLKSKSTACLDEDKCGIPNEKLNVSLSNLNNNSTSCSLESGCC